MATDGGDAPARTARLLFEREGTELACWDFGGSGAPVMLLHGLAGHGGEWRETAGWLTQDHRVLALDQRGHGWSTRSPEDVSREAHVADVAHVIEKLELGSVVLIGQSLGGNLAFLVASRHPELVRALVVAEASPDPDPDGAGADAARSWLEGWPTPFPTRDAAVAFFEGPSLYATAWADGLEQRGAGWWPRFDREVMVRTVREATQHDYWSEWERIECPALVVKAGSGLFPGSRLQTMAERLPGARFLELAGAKHDLHLDRPASWRQAVAGFLATVRPVASARASLRRHPSLDERFDPAVRICAHDPAWSAHAQEELQRIKRALGAVALRLEHVGSTAVPGLAAKPILDLQLTVAHVEPRQRYERGLSQLGYVFIADPRSPDYHFFARPLARARSHHLHVCQLGSEHELRHLAVRDFLRAHPPEATEYEALKRDVARRHPQDRLAYMAGKERYVDELEARAVSWMQGSSARATGAPTAQRRMRRLEAARAAGIAELIS